MRVLIVKVSSLGDIIHTLPAVTDASRVHRNLQFDWVVEENFVEVPNWHPAIQNVIPVALRRWRRNLLKGSVKREFRLFRSALQGVHYDLVIDAQGLIKSGLISRLSRGLTIGLSNRTIREPMATLFYNKVYSVPWSEHAVDRVRQLFARALKYRYDKTDVDYGIDLQRIDSDQSVPQGRRVVFLHGTTWATKHWPEPYWRELARLATSDGFEVLLPWGDEEEKSRAALIAQGIAGVSVLNRLDLTGIARQINRASGVIAVDTGLGHLAAALSKPTVSLYGPTNPGLTGTCGKRQLHLTSDLGCSPCIKKTCSYKGPEITDRVDDRQISVTPACFHSNRPELVWRRFSALVNG